MDCARRNAAVPLNAVVFTCSNQGIGTLICGPADSMDMYVGRFLIAGPGLGAYRVSSRSFPNRKAVAHNGTVTVVPTAAADPSDNPYVSYNCLRMIDADAGPTSGPRAVLGNGSHVDPVTEKLALGYPARDALAAALLTLDYEKDDYDTPRIAAVVAADTATIGIVREDALVVRRVDEQTLVATYEHDDPEPFSLEAETAPEAARAAYHLRFEHPICAVGVEVTTEVDSAILNEPDS